MTFSTDQSEVRPQTRQFVFRGMEDIDTPALVVYADRVQQNIAQAVSMVGDVARLRPHMKTSKCAAVCQLLLDAGVTKFKCATIAEAELTAMAGAPDVLLSYQPVGPKVTRLLQLINKYPNTRFSCLVDHPLPAKALAAAAFRLAINVGVYIDLNVGMNRSGIQPGAQAIDLYETCTRLKGLEVHGLHVYEGHINHFDLLERKKACDEAYMGVQQMRSELVALGYARPALVAGGSPTFPIHAGYPDRECSPGTFVYWDAAYAEAFPEQPFVPAALLLTRVVSVPDAQTRTLDLGHKAVASENDLIHRFQLLDAPESFPIMHSEEHVVLRVPESAGMQVGDVLFALPFHICPTVALHQQVHVVANGELSGAWPTTARDRCIGV